MQFVIKSLHGETDLRLTFYIIHSTWKNSRLVSSEVSLTSGRKGSSLVLVGHPSSDGVTMKIPYRADVLLQRPASHPRNLRIYLHLLKKSLMTNFISCAVAVLSPIFLNL